MNHDDGYRFPSPIAIAYSEYDKATDRSARFRCAVRLGTSIIKYCSSIILADYIDRLTHADKKANREKDAREGKERKQGDRKKGEFQEVGQKGVDQRIESQEKNASEMNGTDPDITLDIHTLLFRASMGHWNQFIREILLSYRRQEIPLSGFLNELDQNYFKFKHPKKASPNQLALLINDLIVIRNDWFHPGIDPDDSTAPMLFDKLDAMIGEMMRLTEFLTRYELYAMLDGKKISLMGDGPCQVSEEDLLRQDATARQLFIDIDINRSIPISFLVESKRRESGTEHLVMLFETAKTNSARSINLLKYTIGNHWGFDNVLFTSLANSIKEMTQVVKKESIASVSSVTWAHLSAVAHKLLADNRNQLEQSGSIIAGLHVTRDAIEGEGGVFQRFLDDPAFRCLTILGDSGHGKTNTMWKLLTHPMLRAAKNDYALLFFEARNIDPQGFEVEVDRKLFCPGGLRSVLQELACQEGEFLGKHVICFIDAINEYSNPSSLAGELLDLVSEDNPWFRVVITCRNIAWMRIHVSLNSNQEEMIFSELIAGERKYPSLSRFSDSEWPAAYEKYRTRFAIETVSADLSARTMSMLRDPLMLRLACEAYEGTPAVPGRIPSDVSIDVIFDTYDRKATIDPRKDEPFLDQMIHIMWDENTSSLTGETIRKDALLQDIVYEPPVNITPGSSFLCNGCKTILTPGQSDFTVDDPCPICDSMDVKPVHTDWRTTYERLLDEGIITEDIRGDDMGLRFVYDRYFEYRAARWLTETFHLHDKEAIRSLIAHAARGDTPILLEAVKLAIRLSDSVDQIIPDLAQSEDPMLSDIATGIIIDLAREGNTDTIRSLILQMNQINTHARLAVIRAAVSAGSAADDAILARIPKRSQGKELIQAAIGKALYLIWRQDPGRATGLMEHLSTDVSVNRLIRNDTGRIVLLLDVTFKVLGVSHHDPRIVRALGDFWIRILNHNLRLNRTGPIASLISKGLRWILINGASVYAASLLKRYGLACGDEKNALSDEETDAISVMLDAWQPGHPVTETIADAILNYGPNALDDQQRSRKCAIILCFFLVPACVAGMRENRRRTIETFHRIFDEAGHLHDDGRATRFFACSAFNFSVQLLYPLMQNDSSEGHPMEEPYHRSHSWLLTLLTDDPDMFAISELIEGAPNTSFGVHFQSAVRMGKDVIEEIVEPMLSAARNGHPDLVRAFLRVSLFCLDTFSQRISAHLSMLRSLEYLTRIDSLSTALGWEEKHLKNLIIEAYSVISLGYPMDAELFIVRNNHLPAGTLELVRQAKSRPSRLFDCDESLSLDQYVSRTLQDWTLSDGGNSMLCFFPEARDAIVKYCREVIATGDERCVLKKATRNILDYLVHHESATAQRIR
ncbi:hypothetical protein JXA80_07490 [bacterium]|nr:hypothetical protein [candidate division CSSED10-310 bacterium]